MRERISALMDGELTEAERGRDLAALKASPDLRQVWDSYHLIGDSIRGHLGPALASRVSARLAAEPTVLAPPRPAVAGRISQIARPAAAVAAAVALVVWMAAPPEPQQVAVSPPPVPAVAATPAAVGVENYLLAHQSFSPAGAMQGVAPYVRTVSNGQGNRSK